LKLKGKFLEAPYREEIKGIPSLKELSVNVRFAER
jgi:hypothetical protein